jgi:SAM-dependent methyltransferase
VFEFVKEVIDGVEADVEVIDRQSALRALRPLGIDRFGALLISMPNMAYPKLSHLLPAMASDEVQRNWTGDCGPALLRLSVGFVRSLAYHYVRLTGRGLENAKILDFGCGYGRLLRLVYALTDTHNVYGVDPWPISIEICHEAGLTENMFVSDYLPTSLPTGDVNFDLAYAFSVFTHLSQRATLASLGTLHRYMKPEGLLAITVRPVEYWQYDAHTTDEEKVQLAEEHRTNGFAFKPHDRPALDGDITYGDTSMTLDWITRNLPDWRIVSSDYLDIDPFQRLVFLQAV